MSTILGLSGVEKIAPYIDEVLAGDASLGWLHGACDSNCIQGGGGYGRSTRLNIAAVLGIPILATHTATGGIMTTANVSYMDDSTTSDFVTDQLRTAANGGDDDQSNEADYTGLDPVLQPYMPTTAAMRVVDKFVPGVPVAGESVGTPRYQLTHEATTVGYNFNEVYNIYIAHLEDAALGSHTWQVRLLTGSTQIKTGTIDHSPASPTGATVVQLLDTTAVDSFTAGTILQLLPFHNNQTLTGINMVLSMFLTWPNRGHGYAVFPIIVQGGTSLTQKAAAISDANQKWLLWKFIAAAKAMEGRRSHFFYEIQDVLNDNTTEAAFLTALTTVTNAALAAWDAGVASGAIPSNCSFTVLFSGCLHRINNEDITYGYNAARTLEASNSRFVVADFQSMMTSAASDVICTDGSHLGDGTGTSDANYLMHHKRWFARFLTACRLSRGLRRIAA